MDDVTKGSLETLRALFPEWSVDWHGNDEDCVEYLFASPPFDDGGSDVPWLLVDEWGDDASGDDEIP